MHHSPPVPAAVLAEYGIGAASLAPLGKGLINETWLVRRADGERFVLQHVNPIFPPEVNRDIDIVTRRLAERGLPTTRIVPADSGSLWVDAETGVWRLLTYVDGVSHDALSGPPEAREAGHLLGRFHRTVADMDHTFANLRLGIHDTARHLSFLERTLARRKEHSEYARVAALGAKILDVSKTLPALPRLPDRVVHGDPKINNIIFDAGTGRAICLIDLDTLARMPLPLELGDAMRSWCNSSGEDGRAAGFSAEMFAAAIEGYESEARGWITKAELTSIVPATQIILVELAARFCADALNESYFGWDPEKFSSRSEHNQVRAASQLAVARSLVAQREKLDAIVRNLAMAASDTK